MVLTDAPSLSELVRRTRTEPIMDPLLTQQVAILVAIDQKCTAASEADKDHWVAAANCVSGAVDMDVALQMLVSGQRNTRIPARRDAFGVAAELVRQAMLAEASTVSEIEE